MTSPSLLCWQKVSQGSMSGLLLRWKILSERCVCVCVCAHARAWTCVSLPIPNYCLLYNNELKVLELGRSRSLCGVMSLLCYKSIHCTTYTSVYVRTSVQGLLCPKRSTAYVFRTFVSCSQLWEDKESKSKLNKLNAKVRDAPITYSYQATPTAMHDITIVPHIVG